jgi:hypothetical protein
MLAGKAGAALLLVVLLVDLSARAITDKEKVVNIETRLREAVFSDEQRCMKSDWQKKYNDFHKSMLLAPEPKILVAVPHVSGKLCF